MHRVELGFLFNQVKSGFIPAPANYLNPIYPKSLQSCCGGADDSRCLSNRGLQCTDLQSSLAWTGSSSTGMCRCILWHIPVLPWHMPSPQRDPREVSWEELTQWVRQKLLQPSEDMPLEASGEHNAGKATGAQGLPKRYHNAPQACPVQGDQLQALLHQNMLCINTSQATETTTPSLCFVRTSEGKC